MSGNSKSRSSKGFISFSDVLSGGTTTQSDTAPAIDVSGLSPIYRGENPDLAMVCKRLTKKDLTTKLKAFTETAVLLSHDQGSGALLLPDFLSYYAHIFPRLLMDNERRVREAAFALLMTVITLNKQTLGPIMKHILPYWWLGTGDPCYEVAQLALAAFEAAIPTKKRSAVLLMHYSHIVSLCRTNLDHRPETLSDMAMTSQEEANERFERVLGATLSSLGTFLAALTPEGNAKVLEDATSGYPIILNDTLWRKLTGKKPTVRRGVARLLEATVRHLPEALDASVPRIMAHLLSSFREEAESSNLSVLVDCFLQFTERFRSTCWEVSEIDPICIFVEAIRRQVTSLNVVLAQALMPLLCSLPPAAIVITSTWPFRRNASLSGASGTKHRPKCNVMSPLVSDNTYVSDEINQLVSEIAELTNDGSMAADVITSIDIFVAEMTLVLLLRKPSDDVVIGSEIHELVERRSSALAARLCVSIDILISAAGAADGHNASAVSLRRILAQLAAYKHNEAAYFDIRSLVVNPLFNRIVRSITELSNDASKSRLNIERSTSDVMRYLLEAFSPTHPANVSLFLEMLKTLEAHIDERSSNYSEAIVVSSACKSVAHEIDIPEDLSVAVISKLLGVWGRAIPSVPSDGLRDLLTGLCDDELVLKVMPLFLKSLELCFVTKQLRGVVEIVCFVDSISEEPLVRLLTSVIDPNENTTLATWFRTAFHSINISKSTTIPLFSDASKDDIAKLFVLLLGSSTVFQQVFTTTVLSEEDQTALCGNGSSKIIRWSTLTAISDRMRAREEASFLSSATIVSLLSSAFFSRDRESASIRIHISCWKSLRVNLLPLLSDTLKIAFGTSLVTSLRESIFDPSSCLQPRKLARHMCTLFALIESNRGQFLRSDLCPFSNVLPAILFSLGFLDESVIRTIVYENNVGFANRLAMCLVEISTIWRGDSATSDVVDDDEDVDEDFSSPVHDNEDEDKSVIKTLLPPLDSTNGIDAYFNIFLICDLLMSHSDSSISDRIAVGRLGKMCLRSFSTLSDEIEKQNLSYLFSKICEGDSYDIKKNQFRVCCSIVKAIHSYTPTSGPSLVQPSKMPSVDCLNNAADEASLVENSNVWYIDGTSDEEVIAVQATVVGVHIQSGERPFYSICINGDREIQTEAGRILRSVITKDSEKADVVSDRIMCSSSDQLEYKDTDFLFKEIIRRAEELLLELSDSRVGPDKALKIEFLCELIRVACKSQKMSARKREDLVAFLRGHCTLVLKTNITDTPPELAHHRCDYAIELISSLVDSDCGLGHGVWLVSNIRNVSVAIVASIYGEPLPTITESFSQKMTIGTQLSTAPTAASRLVVCAANQKASSLPPVLLAKLVLGLSRVASRVLISELSNLFITVIPYLLKEVNVEINSSKEYMIVHSVVRGYLSCLFQLKDGERLSSSLLGLTVPVMGLSLRILVTKFDHFQLTDISILKAVASLVLHYAVKRIPGRDEAAAIMQSAVSHSTFGNIGALLSLVSDISGDNIFRLAAAKALDVVYSSSLTEETISKACSLYTTLLARNEDAFSDDLSACRQITAIIIDERLLDILERGLLKRDKKADESPDNLGIICSFLLLLQRLDALGIMQYRKFSSAVVEEGDSLLSAIKTVIGVYLRGSKLLDKAVRLLFKSGALTVIGASGSSPSKGSSKIRNAKNKALIDFQDMLSVSSNETNCSKLAFMDSTYTCSLVDPYFDTDESVMPSESYPDLSAYCLRRTVCTLPSLIRNWWCDDTTDLKGVFRDRFCPFLEEKVHSSILAREVALIHIAEASGRFVSEEEGNEDDSNAELTVTGSVAAGEVRAMYVHSDGESKVQIIIRLPAAYPIALPEIECTHKIGIDESRWRRWQLQIVQLLSRRDGAVVDAVLHWRRNVEKEFKGLEPCPICYSILHPKNASLPKMVCPTCNNKFHNQCLMQWFSQSGKNKCVICQQPFFI